MKKKNKKKKIMAAESERVPVEADGEKESEDEGGLDKQKYADPIEDFCKDKLHIIAIMLSFYYIPVEIPEEGSFQKHSYLYELLNSDIVFQFTVRPDPENCEFSRIVDMEFLRNDSMAVLKRYSVTTGKNQEICDNLEDWGHRQEFAKIAEAALKALEAERRLNSPADTVPAYEYDRNCSVKFKDTEIVKDGLFVNFPGIEFLSKMQVGKYIKSKEDYLLATSGRIAKSASVSANNYRVYWRLQCEFEDDPDEDGCGYE